MRNGSGNVLDNFQNRAQTKEQISRNTPSPSLLLYDRVPTRKTGGKREKGLSSSSVCPSPRPLCRPGLGSVFELRRALVCVCVNTRCRQPLVFVFSLFSPVGHMSRASTVMSFGTARIESMAADADFEEILSACGTKEGDTRVIDLARVGLFPGPRAADTVKDAGW